MQTTNRTMKKNEFAVDNYLPELWRCQNRDDAD
jgi:hypothetical protein